MSKYTMKRIEEITHLTMNEIPNAINSGITVDEYLNKYRMTLNLTVIQAIFGCEFSDPKKEGKTGKVKFNHWRADVGELATICHLINDFISNVENPFLQANISQDGGSNIDEDMIIPSRNVDPAMPGLEKVNNKKIYEYVFGGDGRPAVSKMMITGMDIYDLAAIAKKIHWVKTRNTMILVGGIALVITGGAVATVCIANKKKAEEEEDKDTAPEVDLNDVDVDLDDVNVDLNDIDVKDIDLNDMPKVELPA